MAEGSETPNGEHSGGSEGRARRSEGDLLAERRARRAAESGELALTRRAEAAEATVETLERHVANLQQRLREAEEERVRTDELIEAERAAGVERENELRRVKQREYAEQQLRVETQDQLQALDRDSRAEIERLSDRLGDSEREVRELAQRLDRVQRQLADAEQAAGIEQAGPPGVPGPGARTLAAQNTAARLSELEQRALEIELGLETERAARERSERTLESMRAGQRQMQALLGELKGIVARVSAALAAAERARVAQARAERPSAERATPVSSTRPSRSAIATAASSSEPQGVEMADALANAVQRLRARAESAAPTGDQGAPRGPASTPALPQHKHSMSWFARQRIKRKQRRGR